MNLHTVVSFMARGRRLGRGRGTGRGKTAGRGIKGHGARTGAPKSSRFEGGQMKLTARIPKLRGK